MSGHHGDRDERHMRRALELAALGPAADPNPRVGAVLVGASGDVVGQGYHAGAGTPHAETVALAAAAGRAAGGTAYVTLEPCDHSGRTGPCSRALLEAGIARVVIAQRDPNPVAAGGADRLRAAGVDVETGLLLPEAQALNREWTHAVSTGRPFVTWKFAATLDGRSAAADGTSRWISSPGSRADTHRLRAACGAILVGTGTVLIDDPQLTVRDANDRPVGRQPLRVVMGHRPVPDTARVLDAAAPSLHLPTRDPAAALAALAAREIRHLWLEGGPTLAAAFLGAGLVDEVIAYIAPALLGAGASAVGDLRIATIADIARLDVEAVDLVGGDVRIRATPRAVRPDGFPPGLRPADIPARATARPAAPAGEELP